MNELDELIIKYQNTGDKETISKIMKSVELIARGKIRWNRINLDNLEDLLQEIKLKTWRALKNFDPEKGKASTYLAIIIQKGIAGYITKQNYQKRRINNHAASLYKSAPYAEDKKVRLIDVLEGESFEDKLINKLYFNSSLDLLLTKLTDMEKEVLSKFVYYQSDMSRGKGAYELIADDTEYTRKQADNAMQRVRFKAKKIIKECG